MKRSRCFAHLRRMNDDLNIPHCIKNYGRQLPDRAGICLPEEVFLERLRRSRPMQLSTHARVPIPRQPSQEEMEKLLKVLLLRYGGRLLNFIPLPWPAAGPGMMLPQPDNIHPIANFVPSAAGQVQICAFLPICLAFYQLHHRFCSAILIHNSSRYFARWVLGK